MGEGHVFEYDVRPFVRWTVQCFFAVRNRGDPIGRARRDPSPLLELEPDVTALLELPARGELRRRARGTQEQETEQQRLNFDHRAPPSGRRCAPVAWKNSRLG